MSMDSLLTWKTEWDSLPLDPTGVAYPTNIGGFIDSRVTSKLELNGTYTPSAPTAFTFNSSVFAAGITGLVPSPTPSAAATAFSAAFQAACAASVFVVAAGGSVGAPTPATIFSAPPAAVFEPASLTAATAALQTALLAALPVGTPLSSAYPSALYTAFTSLQVLLTGLNSVPPVAGPNPLIATVSVV